MALLYRKIVRDAMVGFLDAGFNPTLEQLAPLYGITPFTIDFTDTSRNFVQAHIEAGDIEQSPLYEFPAACLYTGEASDTGEPRGIPFTGPVIGHLDFFVRDRDGADLSRFRFTREDFFDAIEDAAISVLNNPANRWPAGVIFARQTRMPRERMISLADGYATRIPIATAFRVNRTSL